MGTHVRIINLLKKLQQEQSNPLCLELDLDDTETLMRKYFLNFRGGDPDKTRGLRLTDSGLITMRCFFQSYDIELPGDYRPHIKHILYLDRQCRMPWHLKGNHLILFEKEMAVKAKLTGNLDLLCENFR